MSEGDHAPKRPKQSFHTTQWTLVLAAGSEQAPQAHEAMADLCGRYWQPIYAYIRRRGTDPATAEDLAQGFFMHLLERNSVRAANPDKGRFRSFLLGSLKYYLADEWDRSRAKKRGGGQAPIEIDAAREESHYELEADPDETPDQLFARRWAEELLAHTQRKLELEMKRSRNPERNTRLAAYLTGGEEMKYGDLAAELGMSESAVKVSVHRLRKRFGVLLRDEVASTVGTPDEIDAEIRYLFEILGS